MKSALPNEDKDTFSAELDSMLLAHHPRFRRLLEAAEARYQQGESLSSDEFWTELDRRSTEQNAE